MKISYVYSEKDQMIIDEFENLIKYYATHYEELSSVTEYRLNIRKDVTGKTIHRYQSDYKPMLVHVEEEYEKFMQKVLPEKIYIEEDSSK